MGNAISQILIGSQVQVLAQGYLDQARLHKEAQQFDMALALYDHAKVAFKNIADTRQLVPQLSKVKGALSRASTPQTADDEALRQRIAQVYFERAELLEKLGKEHKAQASYKKARAWGYEERQSASIFPAAGLSVSNASTLAQTAPSASLSTQQKSELVDYLFEKALLMLGALEVSNKPSLFLVYAHDNPVHGQAEATTSKYFIHTLSKIQVNLYSDQTPMGKKYSGSPEALKYDGKLEDIVTNQLCLLPTQLREDVKPVNKVVVCCSEVLGSYLKWSHYQGFYRELREAYRHDCEQKGTSAIREVVKKFSQEPEYKAGFHHVLTEMAFLQIRAEYLKDHGIIPVSLTPGSYDQCLATFISATTVRMEDCLRFDAPAQASQEVSLNQSRHGVLFKLIERVLVSSDEAKTFLDKFWDGHGHFIARLKKESPLSHLEFAQQIDHIFDDIRTALHRQLASTVQQQHQQHWVLNADPRTTLEMQYFAALKQDEVFKQTQQLYVEPRGKAILKGEAETFDLLSKVKALLTNKQVVLLTGDAGAGKSTLNRLLEKQLWEKRAEQDAIPLFIALASMDKPEYDLIAQALKKKGLSEFQIQTLKKEQQPFIFILDGYDEIRQTQNLYLSNRINQSDGWQGRMVISCRSEYLGRDYRSRFQPHPNLKDEDPFFQEVVMEPFSETERHRYLQKYVAHNQMGWALQRYEAALEQPHLKDLVSNPFLLQVVLEALPYLDNEGKARSAVQLRLDLYAHFIRRWFERNQQRLSTQDLKGTQGEIFRALCDDDFARHGIRFVNDLAVHLYTENGSNPVVGYSLFEDEGNWKAAFFGREDKKQLLREAWPLIRNGNQYRFIHKSLLEYCVARALFESFDACIAPHTHSRRGSDASVYSFETEPVLRPPPLLDVSLTPQHWICDLGVVRWLTERVLQEPAFKEQLLAIIERSKTDPTVRRAAANAITILVRAGMQFNGADLQGIQIPGADLSEGVFDSALLQRADLRKVHFRKSWLRSANLKGAQMAGVRFGEWPTLQEESAVRSCTYSPDGKTCAIGLENGTISVYSTSNWEKIHTLRGHTKPVWSVVYSPSGQQIASGSVGQTMRLWDAQTGALTHTLQGHTDSVSSVVYSPSGQQIASGSRDNTVRLWDAQTGALVHTLQGHTSYVSSVVYSPSGQQIASGSFDETVRLWDAQTGALARTLQGHTDSVSSVVYSPSGQQIASGSWDKTVRLWDAQTGVLAHTLQGHTYSVNSVVYSPSGQQIASGSSDKTIRLWDAYTGALAHTLQGHAEPVRSVVYSPSGQQIVSRSFDETVRLWDAQTGTLAHTLQGHTSTVSSVVYSPNGQQIASGSSDHTVRLWDAQTGVLAHTLQGHTYSVNSVVYSPSGQQIASGSQDTTVRLWDAQTGTLARTLQGHTDYVSSVVYSPSGQQIASGSSDKTVRLWDSQTGEPGPTLQGHTAGVLSVVYSPSGQQIASGSGDHTVRLWDTQTGALAHILQGHTGWVNSVVYSPSGQQIASGSHDHTVRLWDSQTGEPGPTLPGHTNSVRSVVYSPSGQQIASGSNDDTVRLWDAQTGEPGPILQGHTHWVSSVVYSPSGQQIASGSQDHTVRLWDAQSGALAHTLQGHTSYVSSVVYSPSGQQIASGSGDKTVRLWDTASGQCVAVIRDFSGAVNSVAWSVTPTGTYLATGCVDHSVRLWQVIEEKEGYQVRLHWSSTHDRLTVSNTSIQGVQGLSRMNQQLLHQRGAVGEPSPSLNVREASKNIARLS